MTFEDRPQFRSIRSCSAPSCARREFQDLSTSSSQATLAPEWKQEVNKRLAAHKSRRSNSAVELEAYRLEQLRQARQGGSSLAAGAAARVAARYAKAPSYSDLLAGEARAAVRAAEAVSRAALDAQAAAESLLAGLESQSVADNSWEFETCATESPDPHSKKEWEFIPEPSFSSALASNHTLDRPSPLVRWESAELPAAAESATIQARESKQSDVFVREWKQQSALNQHAQDALAREAIQFVEPAQPLPANLIEFPRELVATRKVRPRLAEGPQAGVEDSMQLSIFEVDPGSISLDPTVVEAAAAAPSWSEPGWSKIELDAHPFHDGESEFPAAGAAPMLFPASLSRRIMAIVVDCSLVTAVFLAATVLIARGTRALPGLKTMEVCAVFGLLAVAVAYQYVFLALGEGTPGMAWARLSLCTFEDEQPSRLQRRSRLLASLLSLLPMGIGMAWAIFDDERLSWHDRLSRTYLRRC
jgi:uncharacterized RDD family membrane protein YckC